MLQNSIAIGRAEKKWTQQDLANEINVSRQTIISLEKNKYNPSLVLAFKIAHSLGKEITDVFQYEEDVES
ncbi:helix-turn-helix transcriptional regulator [Priestia koreensis]|uniref:DNA-binding protein n=1 Tax=Priestia koreensis TaxID=284581 RepID=A0A0M0KV53_9BACI|nr:helix-turn-helix transcriptional regulator [Priestia koreensis]KOO42710.1 DNA-binding protein [Priestia koreensis]